jgi:hypothetical protein
MKISTGGIGTVATSALASAGSAGSAALYPYQWAWNAVGTDLTSVVGVNTIDVGDNDVVENHQYGIKHSMVSPVGDNASLRYQDEGTDSAGLNPGGDRSGPLNAVDMDKAKYMHMVVDLKSGNHTAGWADGMVNETTNNITQITSEYGFTRNWDNRGWRLEHDDPLFPDDWGHGVLIYNQGGGAASVSGGVAIFPHSLNANTFILVWNLRDQVHRQPIGDAGSWGTESDAPTFIPFTDSEKPDVLSFYPGGSPFKSSVDNYLIIMGYVLADRILKDIPLPVRTHMG